MILIPKVQDSVRHAFHLYPILINFEKFKISKKLFFKKLSKSGINLQVHYIPVYHQPFLKKFNFDKKHFPVSENFYKRAVSLPIYYSLKNAELQYVIKSIKRILDVKQ